MEGNLDAPFQLGFREGNHQISHNQARSGSYQFVIWKKRYKAVRLNPWLNMISIAHIMN